MLTQVIGGKTYEFADTLRVVYALKDITGAKSLKEALESIAHLDIDGQLRLLYVAHKVAAKEAACAQEDFVNEVLDNMGVLAVTDLVSKLADGLMYSGMSPDKVEAKKLEVTETLKTHGATSSVTVTE